MSTRKLTISIILLAAGLLAACTGNSVPTVVMVEDGSASMPMETAADDMMKTTPTEAMMEKEPTPTMMDMGTSDPVMDKETPTAMMDTGMDAMSATPSPEAMDEASKMMETPAWFMAALSDVRSGENFTIKDLAGKVVLVETMAIWCPTCLRQQKQVSELHLLLGMRDDFASVGLGIDPNENAEQLKTYIESNGFDWRYAIAPVDVSREIAQLYGDQFINPPSAPMLIIDWHGNAHPLPFGVKDAQSLMEALEPFLNEEM